MSLWLLAGRNNSYSNHQPQSSKAIAFATAIKHMRRLTTLIFSVALAMFGLVYFVGNPITYAANAFIPYDEALGQLARAESAQTPDEVISYVAIAKEQLPESGPVAWWSAEKGDFESIQAELDDIIIRARNISSPELGNELYNSEMYDIHAKIETILRTLIF